ADAGTGAAQVALDWNAVSGRLGAASESALTLNVRYADGRAPKLAASRKLMWTPDDDVALDEADGALRLYKNGTLTIHTDPYARITISFQDASYSVLADGNGLAKWPPDSSVEIGAAYVVTVTDMFGHQRTSAEMYVEEVRREKIEVEAPEIIGSRLTLNGFAEGGTTIAYDVNGKRGTVELGGQPGTREAFEIPTLDADVLGISSGDEVRIQLFYADGASPSQTVELKPFIWDWKVDLSIETVSEDSDAIVAHCGEAVTASLYLAADGESKAEKVSTVQFSDGELRWPVDGLPIWLDRYARGRIEVKDLYGNTAEETFNVERTAYRDIDLSIASDVSYNGMAAVTADRVTISGYAEPNHEVALAFLALDDESNDAVFTHIETVTASGNGAYAHEFRLNALEAAEDGAWTLASEGDRFQIRAYYQDARHAMWSETMFWDCKGPALTMDGGDTLDKNWSAISGSTEAGATVEMLVNGASAAKKTAENGKFVFKPSDLSSQMRDLTGKTVRIVAHDALGNESEPWERTVEAVPYPGRV
ncbi:MAG: Ig-like domain-containing protein, partial [bacterium]